MKLQVSKSENRAINDLINIYKSKLYINEKGYLQKLVELLYELGYYEDNEEIMEF